MIQVMIVHEFPLMCNIVAAVLDGEPDIEVVGYASTVEEANEKISEHEADVILISSRLPDQGTTEFTNFLFQKMPAVKILILGISETRESVLEYAEAGANGYVLKESSLDDLLASIRAVYNDKVLISPDIAAVLIQRVSEYAKVFARADISPPEAVNLTARELEVLELLSQKMSNQQIAERLVIETGTVKNHVHNILSKLGVDRREEASNLMSIIRGQIKGRN